MSELRYQYEDQEGLHILTRSEVLEAYFAWWSAQMTKVGRADQITEEACIEDWIVTNWACEVNDG